MLLLLSLVFALAAAQQQCGPNEVYKECGTACEPSCKEPNPEFCTFQCVSECQCKDGFYRHSSGRCVRASQCRENADICPENEVFLECGSCEPTCDNPRPQICAAVCRRGCQCRKGFVRDKKGSCVKPQLCDLKTCGPNEERQDCGSPCEPTCENPLGAVQCVVASCIPNKCECKPGFVRKNGKCTPQSECTEQCPENEVIHMCEPCEGTCQNPYPICLEICKMTNGCGCKPGFVRKNGKCIHPSDCENDNVRCKANEEFRRCSSCEGTCDNPTPICTAQCRPPKCQCKEGYVRDDFGRCKRQSECSASGGPRCLVNEEFKECSTCEGTCDNPKPICTKACGPPRCQCIDGYVRGFFGRCRHVSRCTRIG